MRSLKRALRPPWALIERDRVALPRLRARLGEEEGVVVAIAVLVLTVIIILSGMVVISAVDTNAQGTQQISRSTALEAANAGIQAALYRLNAQPSPGVNASDCFTTVDAGVPGASGCPGQTDSYGSRASYTYYVSPVLTQSPNKCTGLWVNAIPGMAISQRCITSIGSSGGMTIRLQQRVAGYSFSNPAPGILSLSNMLWDTTGNQTVTLAGTYQADGTITIGTNGQQVADSFNNATIQWGPAGSLVLANGVTCKAPTCTASQVGTAFPHPTNLPVTAYTQSAATNNDNALLTASWANNSGNPGPPPKNPQYSYDPTTRVLNANNVGSATNPAIWPSGVYNFCTVTLQNSFIQIAVGATVVIYVDSPATGDGCGGGGPAQSPNPDGPQPQPCQNTNAGGFNMPGASQEFYNPNKNSLSLQIFVYGTPGWNSTCPPQGGQGAVNLDDWCNPPNNLLTNPSCPNVSTDLPNPTYGEIYAPDSYVTTSDPGLSWAGSIVAGNFESNDNDIFQFAPAPPTQEFFGTAWTQCPPAPSSGDKTTGCY